MSKVTANILRFIVVLLAQIFVFGLIHLFGCVNAYVYLLALLLLPLELPRWVQYLIAFATGFIVDMFAMSYGVHAFSCVLMMFVRPYLVNALNGRPNDGSIEKLTPGGKDFRWILLYTVILVFIHQLSAVMLEAFTFRHFGRILLVILGNTAFTTILILCFEYLFTPVKK